MQVLQVKKYNKEIAEKKQAKALKRWFEKDNGYGYPVKSMFYFELTDTQGNPTTERQKGYIAFDNFKAVFGKTVGEAVEEFEKHNGG